MPDRPVLRLGHSPDPDDAFMWWPLLEIDGQPPRVETGRFRFVTVSQDIDALNWRAAGESEDDLLEITAISCAQYPFVQHRYAITSCGASMGEGYGPKLVSRMPLTIDELRRGDRIIAVPGERTSAFAVTSILLGKNAFRYEVVPFDQIIESVARGEHDAGLVIHEGQLTFEAAGLHLIADVGDWWWHQHHLPLPLGINVVRRDLARRFGAGTLAQITEILEQSVRCALAHRDESIAYALPFARNMTRDLADEFIGLYVNQYTTDMGEVGTRAIQQFLEQTTLCDLTPGLPALDVIKPASTSRIG